MPIKMNRRKCLHKSTCKTAKANAHKSVPKEISLDNYRLTVSVVRQGDFFGAFRNRPPKNRTRALKNTKFVEWAHAWKNFANTKNATFPSAFTALLCNYSFRGVVETVEIFIWKNKSNPKKVCFGIFTLWYLLSVTCLPGFRVRERDRWRRRPASHVRYVGPSARHWASGHVSRDSSRVQKSSDLCRVPSAAQTSLLAYCPQKKFVKNFFSVIRFW